MLRFCFNYYTENILVCKITQAVPLQGLLVLLGLFTGLQTDKA